MDFFGTPWVARSMVKDSLKQLNRIKISFTMKGKELTGSITSNQTCFGPKFFLLAQMLPVFKSKIVLCLPANKQRNSPTLFSLFEQCYQEVGWPNGKMSCQLIAWMKTPRHSKASSNVGKIISRHSPGYQASATSWSTGSTSLKSQHSCSCMITCTIECSFWDTSRRNSFA